MNRSIYKKKFTDNSSFFLTCTNTVHNWCHSTTTSYRRNTKSLNGTPWGPLSNLQFTDLNYLNKNHVKSSVQFWCRLKKNANIDLRLQREYIVPNKLKMLPFTVSSQTIVLRNGSTSGRSISTVLLSMFSLKSTTINVFLPKHQWHACFLEREILLKRSK